MDEKVKDWLLEDNSWLKFAVENQLLGKKAEPSLATADSKIQIVINRLKDSSVGISSLKSGKVAYTSTGNAFWDLFFLSDIGLRVEDIYIQDEIKNLFELQQEDGTFILQDGTKSGYFCIPTIIFASLVKMGCDYDPHILRFIEKIFETQRLDGGWHCASNRATGKKLQDSESCPMDNLNVLMLLGQYDAYRNDARLNEAIDLLLTHWKKRMEPWRPYGFGIGNDFLKLKYPAVKYGILRVLDVLSLYPYAIKSPEFNEMLEFAMKKTVDGRFFAESVSRSYSEFDFGQTKQPSKWITFLIYRIQKQVG
jgi:hypothetical protein